jgi:hypothetical protein
MLGDRSLGLIKIYFERLRRDGVPTSTPQLQRDSAAIKLGISTTPTEINKTYGSITEKQTRSCY